MGNGFDASISTPAAVQPNNSYWGDIAAESQLPPVQAQSAIDAHPPWAPGLPVLETHDSQSPLPSQDPIDALSTAEASLAQHGMTAATKDLYTQAIKAADTAYKPQDFPILQTLTEVLQSGKKVDGTELTGAERFQGHKILDAELQTLQLGVQVRLIYASMLHNSRQFATEESVLKDAIQVADRLPQDLIKKQSQLLQADQMNSSLDREQQISVGEMLRVSIGDKSLKTPGYAYLPTLTRLATAEFYVSAEARDDNKTPNGVLKPQLALEMLDSAKTSYQQTFNADITKKGTDSTYDQVSDVAHMMLPENLKELKSDVDDFWSNPLVDFTVAGLAFLAASRLHINPGMIKAGLATSEGLTLGGKAVMTAAMLGTATVGRHYGRELLTGSSESWMDSTIHGAAGLAEIGLIIGTRGKLSNALFKGANTESALLRVAEAKGTEGTLTSGALKDLYAAKKWTIPNSLSSLDSSAVIVKDGALVNSLDLGLNAAKSAELAKAALTGPAGNVFARGAKFAWNLPGNVVGTVGAVVNPKALDLATASARQITARGNATSYLAGLAGAEGYRAITSLDRAHDPVTGERISYAQSFADNMLSPEPFIDGLVMMPLLKPGIMPRNFYEQGAGRIKNAWSSVTHGLSHLGPSSALANSKNAFTRAAMTTFPVSLGTAEVLQGAATRITGQGPSYQIQDLIDQENGR